MRNRAIPTTKVAATNRWCFTDNVRFSGALPLPNLPQIARGAATRTLAVCHPTDAGPLVDPAARKRYTYDARHGSRGRGELHPDGPSAGLIRRLRPALPQLVEDIVNQIQRDEPAYAGPTTGAWATAKPATDLTWDPCILPCELPPVTPGTVCAVSPANTQYPLNCSPILQTVPGTCSPPWPTLVMMRSSSRCRSTVPLLAGSPSTIKNARRPARAGKPARLARGET